MDKLINEFVVNRPIDEAWAVLTDVERIAPCMPGAQLEEIEGEVYRGVVKIKLGAISTAFRGQARFVERDDINHRAVLHGEGRDTTGKGNADALVTATLHEVTPGSTRVNIETDLRITGKVAQFGRGVMADVSAKLMGQFAANLEKLLEEDNAAPMADTVADAPLADAPLAAAPSAGAPSAGPAPGEASPAEANGSADAAAAPAEAAPKSTGPRKINMPEPKAVDLLDTAGAPVLKRLAPVLGVLFALFLLRRKLRRK